MEPFALFSRNWRTKLNLNLSQSVVLPSAHAQGVTLKISQVIYNASMQPRLCLSRNLDGHGVHTAPIKLSIVPPKTWARFSRSNFWKASRLNVRSVTLVTCEPKPQAHNFHRKSVRCHMRDTLRYLGNEINSFLEGRVLIKKRGSKSIFYKTPTDRSYEGRGQLKDGK